jgi:hypothetical protein
MKLTCLDRDTFRESVFKRDGHKCIVCGKEAADAHHIMERRLFPDGGYYIDNGASLCPECHIKAEQTLIQPKELYEILNIKKRILPPDLYDEFEYTKWGDIILANGSRLKGPLFEDESVQKILQSGGVLSSYSQYIKYPRSFHLPWSESRTDDDRTLENCNHFIGKQVIATLKLDGENTSFYSDGYLHARSIDAESHFTQSWVRNLAAEVGYNLPEGWRVCGENLFAKHSIKYNDLATYFYTFSIWNDKNICLSWDDTDTWASMLDLQLVPVFYRGIFDEKEIKAKFEPFRNKHEGYVLRLVDSFHYSQFKYSLAKFVRKNHVQTSNHWKFERIERNGLK